VSVDVRPELAVALALIVIIDRYERQREENGDTRPQRSVAGQLQQCSCAGVRILWHLPLLQQSVSSTALEEQAQSGYKRKRRVDLLAVQHPTHRRNPWFTLDNERSFEV
jgi:hypothetical protein